MRRILSSVSDLGCACARSSFVSHDEVLMEIRFRSSSSPARPIRMIAVFFPFVVFGTD
jgi:hypothetical protein